MEYYNGKTAIVTGGGSGIGRALALELTRYGARVWVVGLDAESVESVAKECGADAVAREIDVRDEAAVRVVVNEAHRAAGGRLDFIFNNAGISLAGEVDEIPSQAWDEIIDVNIRGTVNGVQAAYPLMVAQGFGHIVNTSSLAGIAATPLMTPYAMTKYAIVGLSKSLRTEAAGRGVRVSVLCPGLIETPLLERTGLSSPEPVWMPNVRRMLTRMSGPAYPADAFAREALTKVARNQAVIVSPGRSRMAAFMSNFAPRMAAGMWSKTIEAERQQRRQQT